MDTGNGKFTELTNDKHGELIQKGVDGLFKENETIRLRGSLFKVDTIDEQSLTLKLLPQDTLVSGLITEEDKIQKQLVRSHKQKSTKKDRNFFNKGRIH